MKTDIHIRAARQTDGDFIASLASRFSDFDLPPWRSVRELDSANRAALQKTLENPAPDSSIFIAEDENGIPAGFICLQTQTDYFNGEKHGYISDVAVEKDFEGRGIGRALMEKAEEWARSKKYRLLTLYVFADNQRAQRLYEKIGFRPEVVKYAKVIYPQGENDGQETQQP